MLEYKVLSMIINKPLLFEKVLHMKLFYDNKARQLYEIAKKIYFQFEDLKNKTFVEYFTQHNIDLTFYRTIIRDYSTSEAYFETYLNDLIKQNKRVKLDSVLQMLHINNFDIDEIIEEIENEVINYQEVAQKDTFNIGECEKEHMEDLQKEDNTEKIDLGFRYFTEKEGGNRLTEVMYLAARPSTGKTATAINKLKHALLNDAKGMIFTAEVDKRFITRKINCSMASVKELDVENKSFTNKDKTNYRDAAARVYEKKNNLIVVNVPNIEIHELVRKAKYNVRKHKLKYIIIDHLHIIGHKNRKLSEIDKLTDISKKIKQLARDTNTFIVCLAQMNRDIEKRAEDSIPKMADIRGSGGIEENSDIIIFITKDSTEGENIDILKYYVSKNRNGKKDFFYKARFYKEMCKIEEW